MKVGIIVDADGSRVEFALESAEERELRGIVLALAPVGRSPTLAEALKVIVVGTLKKRNAERIAAGVAREVR